MPAIVEKNEPEIPYDTGKGDPDAISRMRIVIPVNCYHRARDLPAVREEILGLSELFHIAPGMFKGDIVTPDDLMCVREGVKGIGFIENLSVAHEEGILIRGVRVIEFLINCLKRDAIIFGKAVQPCLCNL